jgi:drug/metabolite transporter (DMT)-like permease
VLGLLAYVIAVEPGRLRAFRTMGRGGLAVAGLLAISSASFLVALNHASVASVLFMQALAPILAAALGTFLGEPVPRRTWGAMALALAGVGLMTGGPGRPPLAGVLLALLMTTSFAVMLVITRHLRDVSMAPATCLSQAFVFLLAAPLASPVQVGGRDLGFFVALGVTQIGLGLVFLTIGGRLIPAAEVALIALLEVVLGPLWVWLALSERPSTATLAGGGIVLVAVAVQASSPPQSG